MIVFNFPEKWRFFETKLEEYIVNQAIKNPDYFYTEQGYSIVYSDCLSCYVTCANHVPAVLITRWVIDLERVYYSLSVSHFR